MYVKYLDVQPYDIEGRTDQQIADSMNADPRTKGNFDLGNLRLFLRDNGLLLMGLDGKWSGAIGDAYSTLPSQLKAAVNKLASIIVSEDRPIPTTDLTVATEFKLAADGLLATKTITQPNYDALYAMAGRFKYMGVTAQDVATARAEYQREHGVSLLLNAVQNAATTAKQADGWTVESVKTAMLAALEA